MVCAELLQDAGQLKTLRQMVQPLEFVGEAVSVADLEGNRFLYVNPAWVRLYGYTAREVMGKQVESVLNMDDISRRVLDLIASGTRNGGWKGHVVNHDKKGAMFTVNLRTACLYDAEGEPMGLLGVASRVSQTPVEGGARNALSKPQSVLRNWRKKMGSVTPRELEVFEWLGRGRNTRQLAEELGMSKYTVQSHRNNLKEKLGARTRSELDYLAFLWVNSGRRKG